MTPYAVLLAKPTDDDNAIRAAYHVLARQLHPDLGGPFSEDWYKVTVAYTSIKTEEARKLWEGRQKGLSKVCTNCSGSGVKGTRLLGGKIRHCDVCKGEGRL